MTVGGTVTTAGRLALAGQVNGAVPITFAYLAFDASDAAESDAHTGPVSEITTGIDRILAICSVEAPDRTVWTATIAPTAEITIKAVCIMSAATGGTMLIRGLVSPAMTIASGTSRQFTWKIGNVQGTV